MNVTVPGAFVYSVGLPTATTLPCAEISRVSVPRLTSETRTDAALIDAPADSRRATVGTTQISAASTAAPAAPITTQRRRGCSGWMRRSWAVVSRIIAGVPRTVRIQCPQQRPCQQRE
jgi:hypothetical protein